MEGPADHLLPSVTSVDKPREPDFAETSNKHADGAGTTKRKELHGTTCIRALSGTWANEPMDITLNAYELKFVSDQVGKKYSGFVLLIDAALDGDITDQEIELYLRKARVVKCSVSICGEVKLNAAQVEKSKLFHELLFNGLFSKLFVKSKSNGIQKDFLLQEGKRVLWSSSNMYLLLPVEPSSASLEPIRIKWKEIDDCLSVVELMRNMHSVANKLSNGSSFTCSKNSDQTNSEGLDVIHMANKSVHIQSLKDMVVMAVHTGRIYTVLDVIYNKNAESPFDKDEGKESKHSSFADYYRKMYCIELQHSGQPMLLVKHSHHPHNLLLPTFKSEGSVERPHVHVPPELLVDLVISPEVLRSFYLLHSVMHRLSSMMLACQLREYIGCSDNDNHISCSLILEAITTSRCCENFSLERLELLGDSVLKYAVSCQFFLKYPVKDEGQLSEHRSWAISNSTLHKLGGARSLQIYIRDSPFDPHRWVAPGQIPLQSVPCRCGVDTSDVPLETTYFTENPSTETRKTCDMGHRWMCSKTLADCVEALIGAYYISSGLNAACSEMRWLGMNITFEPLLVRETKRNASLSRVVETEILESKLNYTFSVKGLLVEAITHPSQQQRGVDYNYERLEFLGDAVLDFLVTCYLFKSHTDIDPGELTDLRSASVSNENFAKATVRHNFHQHILHASEVQWEQIIDYADSISDEYDKKDDFVIVLGLPKELKVLGDIFESIAGAVLIDTDLDLDIVGGIFEPLLSPIVTPEKLELAPIRELLELCNHLGYFINVECENEGEKVVVKISVQLEDDLMVGYGYASRRKETRAEAAFCVLKDLKKKGISYAQEITTKRKSVHSNDKMHTSSDNIQGLFSHSQPSMDSTLEEDCQQDNFVEDARDFGLNESESVLGKPAAEPVLWHAPCSGETRRYVSSLS